VVGIFYSNTVDLGSGGGTVKAVMDAAVAQVNSKGQTFNYNPTAGSPTTIGMIAPEPFTSAVLENEYPAGTYAQTESFGAHTPNPYTVWQYYIFDEHNVYLNRGKGPIPFDHPEAHVPDGGSVVWRLISILAAPVDATPKLLAQLKPRRY